MPSPPPDFDRIPDTDIPRAMLLDLAQLHGIGPEVLDVLRAKEAAGQYGLRGMALSRVLRLTRAGRTRNAMALETTLAPSIVATLEDGLSKNMRLDTAFRLAKGYRLPWLIVICSALREYGFLPAPGAKPTPRNRTRVRKSD
jgi:hypothetical protein